MQNIANKADSTAGATGQLPASEYNDHKNELQSSVTRSGQTLSAAITTQLAQAMFINGIGASSMNDGGSANAIQLSPPTGASGLAVPENYAEIDGGIFRFTKSVANTSQTVVLSAGQTGTELAAKSVVKSDGSTLPNIGELLGIITVMYDSGVDKWLVLNIYNDLDMFRDGDDVRLWTSGESVVVGDIRKIGGLQHVCYQAHVASSTNSPLSQDGSAYWFSHGDAPLLYRDFNKGECNSGGMSGMFNRAGGNYQQNIKIAQYYVNGVLQDFYAVALDGTTVTGNTTLEDDIFDVSGSGSGAYAYLDKYLPDSMGTRYMIEMGGHVVEFQTSGGVVDTQGEIHDDYMMRITGQIEVRPVSGGGDVNVDSNGVFTLNPDTGSLTTSLGVAGSYVTDFVEFNSADSISPNPAKTNDDRTAHAALVAGAAYIIVMRAA